MNAKRLTLTRMICQPLFTKNALPTSGKGLCVPKQVYRIFGHSVVRMSEVMKKAQPPRSRRIGQVWAFVFLGITYVEFGSQYDGMKVKAAPRPKRENHLLAQVAADGAGG